MNKSVIIFSGYNQRAVIAFIRTLECNNVKYGIIAASNEDTIFLTKYKDKVFSIRRQKDLVKDDILSCVEELKLKLKSKEYIVAPSTEAINRYLLEERDTFQLRSCVIPLVDKDLYEILSDKYKFNLYCKDNDIGIPFEYDNIEIVDYPFVAKPRQYYSNGNKTYDPIIIKNDNDKEYFSKAFDAKYFYFQDYIKGKSLYLLYYFYGDGDYLAFAQENKIQQPGGKSMIAAVSSDFYKSSESNKYIDIFRSLKFRGFVMVEVKKDGENCKMIEANPRFWGPSQLFVDAGVNFFEAFLYDYGLITSKPIFDRLKNTRYFWGGGLAIAKNTSGHVDYHDYSEKKFKKEYNRWVGIDIYNREDTIGIFNSEGVYEGRRVQAS